MRGADHDVRKVVLAESDAGLGQDNCEDHLVGGGLRSHVVLGDVGLVDLWGGLVAT